MLTEKQEIKKSNGHLFSLLLVDEEFKFSSSQNKEIKSLIRKVLNRSAHFLKNLSSFQSIDVEYEVANKANDNWYIIINAYFGKLSDKSFMTNTMELFENIMKKELVLMFKKYLRDS